MKLFERIPFLTSLRIRVLWPILALALLVAWNGPAQAQTTTRILDLSSLYQTDPRALALGNAYGSIARGEGALLYNPAGLVQYNLDIKIDAGLAVEGEEGDFLSDTYDVLDSGTSAELLAYLGKYLSTTQNYRGQTFYNIVANLSLFNMGFGGGVMEQTRYAFEFEDTNTNAATDLTDTFIETKRNLDITFGSFGFAILDGQWMIGVTMKSFTYTEESASATFGDVIVNGNVDLTTVGNSYKGSGYDVGMIWRLEWLGFLRGQWSLVAQNVGDITMTATGADTLLIPGTYNVGFAIQPDISFLPINVVMSAEVEDVTGEIMVFDPIDGLEHERGTKQRSHYGVEVGMFSTTTGNNILNVRVGAHRGFLSYGYELNLFSAFRLIYTNYRENLGHSDAQDLHDYDLYQLSLGFGF